MSKDYEPSNPFQNDPYRSPETIHQPVVSVTTRPGALTAISVLAIVLGSLGLIGACLGVGGLIFQDQLSKFGVAGQKSTGDKDMETIQEKVNEVQKRFTVVNIAVTVVHFPVAILLVVGGIQAMKLRAGGRKVLATALIGAIVFEIARGVVAAIIQVSTINAINVEIRKLSGNNAAAMFQSIMYVSIGCAGAFLLAKLVLYGWAVIYLNKPNIRSLYEPDHEFAP